MNIIEGEVLQKAWCSTIIRAYDTYRDFIEKRRHDLGNPFLYTEFEVLRNWLYEQRRAEHHVLQARSAKPLEHAAETNMALR